MPYKLQDRWRYIVDKIHEKKRNITVGDISCFMEHSARSFNNPMFGKLSFLNSKEKNAEPKTDKYKRSCSGDNRLSFVASVNIENIPPDDFKASERSDVS